jgi:hypothetical protein
MPTIFGPAARDQQNPAANPARLVNLFREPVVAGGITSYILRSAQGMSEYIPSQQLFARDMIDMDGTLYAAIGNGLYRMDASRTKVGTITSDSETFIARNREKVTLTAGGTYYVWDGSTLSTHTGAITSFGSVTYLAGRTISSELDGNKFQWSDIDDPKTLPGLNFASAEQRDDKLLRVLAVNGVLMAFGERSTEVWAATGLGGADAFQLLPGAVLDTGIKARGLVCAINGGSFLIGSDGVAYIASGTQWEAVSPPAVNSAIEYSSPQRCLYWEHGGHKFAAITFDGRPAWVFDLATKEWFERTHGDDWPIACACGFAGDYLFGGDDGAIYEPVENGTDFAAPMIRQATSGMVYNSGAYVTINELEFNASYGAQIMSQAAQLQLEISRDGVRWGTPRTVDVGFDGDYLKRAIFRRLGTYRKWAFRLTLSDPCDFAIYADANVA